MLTDRQTPSHHRWLRAFVAGILAAAMTATTLFVMSSPAQAAPAPGPVSTDAAPFTSANKQTQATLDAIEAALPSDWQSRVAAATGRDSVDSEWTAVRDAAIDPDDFICTSTTLRDWLADRIATIDPGVLATLSELGVLDYPALDAIFFETDATPQFFGRDGEFGQVITKNMRNLRKFWDIRSDDIQLVAMHGAMLQDRARMVRLITVLFGVDEATAGQLADQIMTLLRSDPDLENGENPLFTFNAFAFSDEGEPPDPVLGDLPDKIVMGDGIMEAMEAIGLGRMAPQSILGHEFGHHVQFENDLFDSPLPQPEATRRTELMADAYSTYYLVHARGQAINAKRVLGASQSFFEVGDCAFTSPNHHGTPLQRQRSAVWAADLANAARPQGPIMPSLEFANRFDAKLPELVAPDA